MIKFKLNLNNLKIFSQYYQSRRSFNTTIQSLISFKKLWNWMPPASQSTSPIIKIGDPILRKKAEIVPQNQIQSKEIQFIISKMIDILRNNNCVGLAAPQIGISLQIIVMEFPDKLKNEFSPKTYKLRKMETLPLTILLNPKITYIKSSKKIFYESCASILGYAGEVERFEEIILDGLNENGISTKLNLKGWNARIAQHEMDHLNGIIYIDKMNCLTFKCTNLKNRK